MRRMSCEPLIGELACLGQERVKACVVKMLVTDDGRHQHQLDFPARARIDVIEGLAREDGHDHALRCLRINLAGDLGRTRAYIADKVDDIPWAYVLSEAALGSDHEGCRHK